MELPGDSQATSLEDLQGTNFLSKKKHLPRGRPPPKLIPTLASGEELPSPELVGNSAPEEELTPSGPGGSVREHLWKETTWGPAGAGDATYRNLCY